MSTMSPSFAEILQRNHRVTGNTYPVKEQLKQLGCVWGKSERCWFAPDKETQAKAQELVGGKIYNAPPPADLTGDEPPEDLAAKFGRVALPDATVKTFAEYSLARGDNGDENGTIRIIKGVR